MITAIAIIIGVLLGWRRAKARGGDRLDAMQYAAAHAIAFGLAAFALSILIQRLAG